MRTSQSYPKRHSNWLRAVDMKSNLWFCRTVLCSRCGNYGIWYDGKNIIYCHQSRPGLPVNDVNAYARGPIPLDFLRKIQTWSDIIFMYITAEMQGFPLCLYFYSHPKLFIIRPLIQCTSGLLLHNSLGNKRTFEVTVWYVCCDLHDFWCHTGNSKPSTNSVLMLVPSHFALLLFLSFFFFFFFFTVHIWKKEEALSQSICYLQCISFN